MADTKISALTATAPALSTHRIPIAISPFGAGNNGYLTPTELAIFANVSAWTLGAGGTFTAPVTTVGSTTNIYTHQVASLGVTVTPVYTLENPTAAAAGAQQISPPFRKRARGWSTNAGGASMTCDFVEYVLPVQGAAAPTAVWNLATSINGAALTNRLQVTSNGELITTSIYQSVSGTSLSGSNIVLNATNANIRANSTTAMPNIAVGINGITFTQAANSSAWAPILLTTPGAHTAMTASTAFRSQDFTGATWTWGSGTIAIQPFTHFRSFTLAGTSGTNTATIATTIQVDPPVVGTNAAITNNYTIYHTGKEGYDQTITAGGTTGNQVINKPSGTVNIAASGTTVTVTNSLCTASSTVLAIVRTGDATAFVKNVVPSAGSFVINLGAAATGEVSIGFIVFN